MKLTCNSWDRIGQYASRLETLVGTSILQYKNPVLDLMWLQTLPPTSSKHSQVLEDVITRLKTQLYSLSPTDLETFARYLVKSNKAKPEGDSLLTFIHDCPYLLPKAGVEKLKFALEKQAGRKIPQLFFLSSQEEFDCNTKSKHCVGHFGQVPSGYKLRINKEENFIVLKSLVHKVHVKVAGIKHNKVADMNQVFTECIDSDWDLTAVDFPGGLLAPEAWSQMLATLLSYPDRFRLQNPPNVIQRQEFGLARTDPMLSISHILGSNAKAVLHAAPSYTEQIEHIAGLSMDSSFPLYSAFCTACHLEACAFLKSVGTTGCNYCTGNKSIPLPRSQLAPLVSRPFRDWYYWQLSLEVLKHIQTGKKLLVCVHYPMHFDVVKNLAQLLGGAEAPQMPVFKATEEAKIVGEAMLDSNLNAVFKHNKGNIATEQLRLQQLPEALKVWKPSKTDKSCLAVSQLKKLD